MSYQAVIGLEVHIQLLTESKLFCRCPNRFGASPNTQVCPICLGYPGALPVLNRRAVDLALRLALAFGSKVHGESAFARKSYFYPDLPKGYQITQYDRPLATGGALPLMRHPREVRVRRLHLEEDAGKLLHELPGGGSLPGRSLVDFNRAGVPLVEIVSEPELASPAEADDYLQTLRQLLLYTGTSDANMEEGSLRCDANVSVRRVGEEGLGVQTEVKNLNSFRHTVRALEHEIERQIAVLDSGEEVTRETRTFDAEARVTRALRSKEEAHDYRYFPEPDLPPLTVSEERIAAAAATLPELPWTVRSRFAEGYGLPAEEARVLAATPELARYFEAAAAASSAPPRKVANWVRTEVLRELRERRMEIGEGLDPGSLGALVTLVEEGEISGSAGKEVLAEIWASGEDPAAAVERLRLRQVRDEDEVRAWVEEVLAEQAAAVAEVRAGKTRALGFLVGQVMRRSGGRADPRAVRRMLRAAVEEQPVPGSR